MKLTITVDVQEAIALELVPEGKGSVKASIYGTLVATGPSGLSALVVGSGPVGAELSREPTRAERVSAIDARYIDEELSS